MVLGRARLVLASSRYSADLVRAAVPAARLTGLPLSVDHRRFRPGDQAAARRVLGLSLDKRVILTVARLRVHKGHRLVFQALAALPEALRERFVYLIAGRGRDQALLQAEALALGLEQEVRWLGYVPEDDLPQLYQSADLFVLCTREDPHQPDVEGFGLAFLEAQACGIPVVGARTGGIPEAVEEGRSGWLIDRADPGALADLLRRLVETPEAYRRMGCAARQRVESEYIWEHYLERVVELIHRHGIALQPGCPSAGSDGLRSREPGAAALRARDAEAQRCHPGLQL